MTTMPADKTMTPVADLTLERVRRLEAKVDDLLQAFKAQNQKLDALVDLAAGTRADFSGFMKLYAAQEASVAKIAADMERIKKRLDLAGE